MAEETTTYKIKTVDLPDSAKCACGHSIAAHGSSGKICAGCYCREFTAKVSDDLDAIDKLLVEV